MEETRSGIGWWGIVIVIFLLFIVCGNGWGNGFFGRGGFGNGLWFPGADCFGFQNYKATCDAEKREIIDTASTQYKIEQQAAATRDLVQATAATTNTKIDFYAYQDLRDKLAEQQRLNMMLQNQLYSDAKFNALQTQLSSIQCNMLRRPDVTGIGVSCPSAAILNGLGVNTLSGLNGCCGCGSSVA